MVLTNPNNCGDLLSYWVCAIFIIALIIVASSIITKERVLM
jgi:hypothetical protein